MIHPIREELEPFVEAGHIKKKRHPELPLDIYCYSKSGMYERSDWPYEMRLARGLVVDDNNEIVLRGMPKFFNVEQVDAYQYDWSNVHVTEKLDGTMILISYYEDIGKFLITTKSSFQNEFTEVAHDYFLRNEILINTIRAFPSLTYIFELIHPVSANIVDYRDRENGLYLIGHIENKLPVNFHPVQSWWTLNPKVEEVSQNELYKGWSKPAEEQEGYVVYFPHQGAFLKVKNPAYFQAASIRDHFTYRKLFEMYMDGTLDNSYLEALDEPTKNDALEFIEQVELRQYEYRVIVGRIVRESLVVGDNRARRAAVIKSQCSELGVSTSVAFMWANGKEEEYWKALKKAIWKEAQEWDILQRV